MGGSSIHVVCNDTFQCASSYKPRPLRHENQPGLPDFSACNHGATLKNMERPGYEARADHTRTKTDEPTE